jgi:hypothetical protein
LRIGDLRVSRLLADGSEADRRTASGGCGCDNLPKPMNEEQEPPIALPHPLQDLNGATVAFTEHRNCEMVREVGKLIATEDRLMIETTSVPDEPYRRIARTFVLTQEQADSLERLPDSSSVRWVCRNVLIGGDVA